MENGKKLSQLTEKEIKTLKDEFRTSSIEVLRKYLDDYSISVLIYVFDKALRLQIANSRQIKKIHRFYVRNKKNGKSTRLDF